MNANRYLRRRIRSGMFLGLSVVATAFGLGWLAVILGTLLYEGFSGIDLTILLAVLNCLALAWHAAVFQREWAPAASPAGS